ncbi:MAG: ABC transporter permease [Dongiaceae bacterium]
MTAALILAALAAPWLAPFDPWDAATIDISQAQLPPAFFEGGRWPYLLGTDYQGRDLLSLMLYGLRLSLFVGVVSVVAATVFGVAVGLAAGVFGGWFDAIAMRIAEIQMTFPAILLAILFDGCSRLFFRADQIEIFAIPVVISAIALSSWVQFARVVRVQARIEREKDYVAAARLLDTPWAQIAFTHILPNVANAVFVLATIQLGSAILTEATLSFLGAGLPPSQPSLGTIIRTGNEYLFSGLWWISIFPTAVLVLLIVSINVVGDWLRDLTDPKRQVR